MSAHGESEWAEFTTDLSERRKPGGLGGSVKPDGIGEITLQWSAVSEPARYEVQQKVKDPWWDLLGWFDDWEILPFENVTVDITGTQAVVGNLRYSATYEYQVRSVNAAGPSVWSDTLKTALPSLVVRGHQHDHTVRYEVAPMSATPEPGFPNPATIIPTAVPTAVAAWNAKMSAHGFLICKGETGSCDQTNTDEKTVTVRLVTNSDACRGTACVEPPVAGLSNHRGHGELILEERPVDTTKPRVLQQLYRWTDVPSQHNEPVPNRDNERWRYVGAVLMHEFGHTLGLPHDVPAPSIMPVSGRSLNIQQKRYRLPDEAILWTRARGSERGVRGGAVMLNRNLVAALLTWCLAVLAGCGQAEVEPGVEAGMTVSSSSYPRTYLGQTSIEERIVGADVVARVRMVSVEGGTATAHSSYPTWHIATMKFRFRVLEYLKGSGGSEIVGVVPEEEPLVPHSSGGQDESTGAARGP